MPSSLHQLNDSARLSTVDRGSSHNAVNINLGGLALLGIVGIGVFVVGIAVWALADSRATREQAAIHNEAWHMAFDRATADLKETKTQAWLTERRLLDLETYAMLNGWKVPSDTAHGPTGNLERLTKETPHGRQ